MENTNKNTPIHLLPEQYEKFQAFLAAENIHTTKNDTVKIEHQQARPVIIIDKPNESKDGSKTESKDGSKNESKDGSKSESKTESKNEPDEDKLDDLDDDDLNDDDIDDNDDFDDSDGLID